MVKYMDGCWHCIHPEFLRDQLERSLTRLQLDTLDVCLLHNPEYFLADMKHRGRRDPESARNEFCRRLREAFVFFESQVAAGTIRWYGVSSNTAVSPATDPEATSLTRMLAAAREAGGPVHHFRILQLPINLFEAGALLTRNNGPDNRQTVLEAASAAGIGVLVNRPLNAIVDNRMIRLAASPSQRDGDAISAAIDPFLPETQRGESLSRKALWVLTSTKGVSCVLNGMRTPAYVDDSLGVLPWPLLADVVPIYQAVQRLKLLDVGRLNR
jgi:aryl-alcohol dehydrogenase-like predicted oxidoreductase